eukprot:g2013.t1
MSWSGWKVGLDALVDSDVYAVCIPREMGICEAAVSVARSIDELTAQNAQHRVALVGHSFGARLAYEVAVAMVQSVHVLCLCGADAPFSGGSDAVPCVETVAECISMLRRLGGTPEELLQEEDFIAEMVAPALRADLSKLRAYLSSGVSPRAPAGVGTTLVLAGTEDPRVCQEGLNQWKLAIPQARILRELGGHFFFLKGNALAHTIIDALSSP